MRVKDIKWNYTQKAVNFQFFLVPGSDFRPCWCQVFQWNYTKKCIFQNRINSLKNCNFVAFQKILLNTPHLGWCSAVNFWRNSTRFAGFLAMIFTSKWLLASRNHWGLRNAKKNLQKFINFEKILEISEKFSIIFDVFRISNGITLKRQSIFNFFLIPGSDFRLPGVRFSNGITLRSAFFQNRINFLKI